VNYNSYNIAHAAADLAISAVAEMRQAEKDVALFCNGLAFDAKSPVDIYRAGLDHCGVPMRETAGLNAAALRVLLKNLPRSGAGGTVGSESMAMDASEGSSALSSILDGIPVPRNLSTRSDRLR
jgi:hypothetical protein